jgi:hypothetical protein
MKILLRQPENKTWKLVESSQYLAEAELQSLLEDSPELIPMDEIRPGAVPLVAALREFSLHVGSVDILAFSAEGDIAICECKLAKNTQAKREVIGQILDYAAHLWEMSYEGFDQKIKERRQLNLADWVREAVKSPEWDEEKFRTNVRANLNNGNFILVIAVNEINEELSRIVRYVNTTGNPGYAFAALEMQRFRSGEIEMLVPRVFGPVRSVSSNPRLDLRRKWDWESFSAELGSRSGESEVQVAQKILEWGEQNTTWVWWGEGSQNGSFVPTLHHNGVDYQLFAVYTYAVAELYFYWYQFKAPFNLEEKRLALLHKFNQIEGVNIPSEAINRRPSIKLSTLAEPGALEQFFEIYEWVIEEIKQG